MKNELFVFDTNILISALFDDSGMPALALKKARSRGVLVVSDEVAAEYVAVFSRTKFDKYLPISYRFAFIENIISNALPVIVETIVVACRDPKDDKFLSLAVAANAACIVSGDADLLTMHPFKDIPILRPAAFLDNSRQRRF